MKNLQLMQDNGVNIICIKEGLDSSNATGKLLVTVMSSVAEMELEKIHTQTMAGRKQKAKEGKWNGGFAPYGYTIDNDVLKIVENEAKTENLHFLPPTLLRRYLTTLFIWVKLLMVAEKPKR